MTIVDTWWDAIFGPKRATDIVSISAREGKTIEEVAEEAIREVRRVAADEHLAGLPTEEDSEKIAEEVRDLLEEEGIDHIDIQEFTDDDLAFPPRQSGTVALVADPGRMSITLFRHVGVGTHGRVHSGDAFYLLKGLQNAVAEDVHQWLSENEGKIIGWMQEHAESGHIRDWHCVRPEGWRVRRYIDLGGLLDWASHGEDPAEALEGLTDEEVIDYVDDLLSDGNFALREEPTPEEVRDLVE